MEVLQLWNGLRLWRADVRRQQLRTLLAQQCWDLLTNNVCTGLDNESKERESDYRKPPTRISRRQHMCNVLRPSLQTDFPQIFCRFKQILFSLYRNVLNVHGIENLLHSVHRTLTKDKLNSAIRAKTFHNSFKCLQISQTFEVLDIWSVQVFMAIIFSGTCSAVVKLAHFWPQVCKWQMKPLSFFSLTRLAWIYNTVLNPGDKSRKCCCYT